MINNFIKLLSLLFFSIGFTLCCSAQSPKIISSQGTIPQEFLTPSSIKYKQTIEEYERNQRNKDDFKTKKGKEEFYLASNFNIDDLLQSGYALFNDELGKYANEVMNQLPISDELKKRKNPRIYIVNSNDVNAFATDQGIIFVTLGLLANVETEAQLAFILAHEISHIEEDHGFLLGEDRFKEIQKIARYQLPFLCLDNGDNGRAIYNAYILLKKYPDDQALKKLIAKALYMEVKRQRTADENSESRLSLYNHVNKMEGAIQRVEYIFKKMKARELTVLALKRNYEAWLDDPEDEQLNMAVHSLMVDLATHYDNLDKFSNKPRPKVDDSKPELKEEIEDGKELTREEKIKKANSNEVVDDSRLFAFVDYLDDEDFQNRFNKAKEIVTAREEDEGKSRRNNTYYMVNNSVSLDIDKIVVVNPEYVKLKSNKDRSVQYIQSEEKQAEFRNEIVEVSKMSNLDVKLLGLGELSGTDLESFNNLNELDTYFQQQLELPSQGLHPSTNQTKINDIAESYGTDYFLWTGLISVGRNKIKPLAVGLGVVFPPAFASRIFDKVVYNDDTFFYAILFDVKNGKRRALKLDFIDGSLTNPFMKAHLYDVFNQISSN